MKTVLLIATALALGYLGWVLPTAGGSLVLPTLVVLGIGVVASVAWWFTAHDLIVVSLTVVITMTASVWTFAFSLPASVAWDSGATSQAQAILARLDSSPEKVNGVVPPQPCSTIAIGTIGPISAPYRQCPVFTPVGHIVIFMAEGQTSRGLGYTDRPAATFLDECVRHLVGQWWMFTAETSGTGDCPVGYRFHGA